MKTFHRSHAVLACTFAVACTSEESLIPGDRVDLAALEEQHESKYVTDPALWGKLVFDRSPLERTPSYSDEHAALADVIEAYHSNWLNRDDEKLAGLLEEDIVRIRQGYAAYGKDEVVGELRYESRGERPESHSSSMHLTVRDLGIRITGDAATATYRLDILGGARWEYADLATVLQVFRRHDDGWRLVAHTESLALDDTSAPAVPDDTPSRISPFRFDFIYPASDLERAVEFYAPLLGNPVAISSTRASFRVEDSYFELTTLPIDERIGVKHGMANGYGRIDVESLESLQRKLRNLGADDLRQVPCEGGKCIVSEDPSGNVIAWREADHGAAAPGGSALVSFADYNSTEPMQRAVMNLMQAWMNAAADDLLVNLTDDALWIDESVGLATGADEIGAALGTRWKQLGASDSGIDGELVIEKYSELAVGACTLVILETTLGLRGRPKDSRSFLVTQVWGGPAEQANLEQVFLVRRDEYLGGRVYGMDYTGYPVGNLGVAGAYYKQLFGSEPYRDDNWFGFWSTTSVFGLVGDYPDVESYSPVPHASNGYADLSIDSADEVYEYLQSRDVEFPLVYGINDQPGIDRQPGYAQILAIDSEGNLINFSEYLEY